VRGELEPAWRLLEARRRRLEQLDPLRPADGEPERALRDADEARRSPSLGDPQLRAGHAGRAVLVAGVQLCADDRRPVGQAGMPARGVPAQELLGVRGRLGVPRLRGPQHDACEQHRLAGRERRRRSGLAAVTTEHGLRLVELAPLDEREDQVRGCGVGAVRVADVGAHLLDEPGGHLGLGDLTAEHVKPAERDRGVEERRARSARPGVVDALDPVLLGGLVPIGPEQRERGPEEREAVGRLLL
jgi:hypothetical protein